MINTLLLASRHLDKAALVYQVAESASFYIQNQSPQLHEKLAKIRHIFNRASIGLGLLSFAQLFYQMEKRWSLLHNVTFLRGYPPRLDLRIPIAFILLVAGAYCTIAVIIQTAANRFFQPKENLQAHLPEDAPEEAKNNTKVEWARSEEQSLTQSSLCARALLNISLAFLSPTPFLLITTLFLQTISFMTTARWKMLKYERTFTSFDQGPVDGVFCRGVPPSIQKVEISYFRPMIPAMNQKNEDCYCLSEEEEGDVSQICSSHSAHNSCIVRSIYSSMERFSNPALWFWRSFKPTLRTTHLSRHGWTEKFTYTINIDRSALPSCPTCRDQPGYGELEVATEDAEKPGLLTPAKINLI